MTSELAQELYQREIIKFGRFTLRSGETSQVYFDLRQLISYPGLLNQIIELYIDHSKDLLASDVLICGVAYTGIPMATVYSQRTGLKMIMKRKEAKDYGTKKLIEGQFQPGDKVILLDDVITSGGSLIETIKDLEEVGLQVIQTMVLIDRRPPKLMLESGDLLDNKYPLRSIFTMESLLMSLRDQGVSLPRGLLFSDLSWSGRAKRSQNPVVRRLFELIDRKQTNLVCSADVTTCDQLIRLVEQVGSEICLLKTHVDLLVDFNYKNLISQLRILAEKYDFMILEDRKFADIGNTVRQQYSQGVYHISSWADLVTCHLVMGEGLIKAFQEEINLLGLERAIVPIAQLSNQGNLLTSDYVQQVCQLALKYPDVVAGLICQEQLLNEQYLHLTPGVNLSIKADSLDQQYNTPSKVITEQGSDLIIVGRGIYQASDPHQAAKEYREQAWNAYQQRI